MSQTAKAKARARILDAADSLFGEMGFDATTTREIAERSDVNKALIHYHFKSKDGLLEALLDRYYDDLVGTLTDALVGDRDVHADSDVAAAFTQPDLVERLLRMLDSYVDFLQANRNFARIVQREASSGRHTALIEARTAPLFKAGLVALESRYPASRGGDLAAKHLLVSFYGMVISFFTWEHVIADLVEVRETESSAQRIDAHKRHLRKMVRVVVAALEAEGAEPG